MGHSPKSENYTSNPEDYILVQGNADILNGWVYPRVWTTQITKLIKPGNILLSVRAPVGNVGKTKYPAVIGRGIASIDGDEFIFQLLEKMQFDNYWRKVSTGSTFESISSKDINNALIKFPDFNEREKIGDFLRCLDNYIELHQRKIIKLLKIQQQFSKALLVKSSDDNSVLRFKYFHSQWGLYKLSELSPLRGGYAFKSNEFQNDGVPIIRISNILSNGKVDGEFVYSK